MYFFLSFVEDFFIVRCSRVCRYVDTPSGRFQLFCSNLLQRQSQSLVNHRMLCAKPQEKVLVLNGERAPIHFQNNVKLIIVYANETKSGK